MLGVQTVEIRNKNNGGEKITALYCRLSRLMRKNAALETQGSMWTTDTAEQISIALIF